MANIYVRSTDGSDADSGATWALAKATLNGAAAIDAAGDTIYVSNNHAESTATTLNFSAAGTMASPTKIICASDAAEPPTAVASSATAASSIGAQITFTGNIYIEGISFTSSGAANGGHSLNSGQTYQTFKNCKFICSANDNRPSVSIGGNGSGSTIGLTTLKNCDVKFAQASQRIVLNASDFVWEGGGIVSGGTSPTTLIVPSSDRNQGTALLSGLDLSNAAAALNIFSAGAAGAAIGIMRNSKLPASWSGSLVTGTLLAGSRYEMHNCDSTDTNYRLAITDYAGTIVSDTGVYNDAGASDGTTRISWKLVSAADAEYPLILLETPEIVQWNETTGASKTVTVEIVHNSQGSGTDGVLNDDECWLEVMYLGTAGFPLGTWITDCKADVLATAAAQTTSSASWTGDAAGWDTQKLSVTITPQEKGFIHARVILAKASATVYVDPLVTVA